MYNENVYSELRRLSKIPDDFVNAGWDLNSLEAGGGKGGTLMARVGDTFIVKELSQGDHNCLMEIAESYLEHVKAGDTVLCPIFLHFCYHERFFFAMRNTVGVGPFTALYDLKGCSDDKIIEREGEPVKAVHKRIWNVSMWMGKVAWSEDRIKYYEGKKEARKLEILLPVEHRDHCLRSIERDTEWLASMGLMDYSLLVAVKENPTVPPPSTSEAATLGFKPYIFTNADGKNVAVYISIIDFLQKWTMGKRVARCIKCMECNKATVPPKMYATRFSRHFTNQMSALPEDAAEIPSPTAKPPPAAIAPPAGEIMNEGEVSVQSSVGNIAAEREPIQIGKSEAQRQAEEQNKASLQL